MYILGMYSFLMAWVKIIDKIESVRILFLLYFRFRKILLGVGITQGAAITRMCKRSKSDDN